MFVHLRDLFFEFKVTIYHPWSYQLTGLSSKHNSSDGKAGLLTTVDTHVYTHTLVIWSACPAECSSSPEAAAARFERCHPCCRWQTYNTQPTDLWTKIYTSELWFILLQCDGSHHILTSTCTNFMYTSISSSTTLSPCKDSLPSSLLRLQQPGGITAELVFLLTPSRHTQLNTQSAQHVQACVCVCVSAWERMCITDCIRR